MVNSNTLIYQSKFIGFFDFNTRTYRSIMISFIPLSHLCSIKHTVELYFYVDHLFCILTPLLELKKNEYVWRLIVFAPFLLLIIILVITSPRTQSGDVLLFYVSFSLLLLLLFSFLLLLLLLFFHTFLSARFLGDALIKLYETL